MWQWMCNISDRSEAMSLHFLIFFLPEANMFIFLCFAVHYAPCPSNTPFGNVKGIDGSIHIQFEGQASLFSKGSTPECNTLIPGGDERTLRRIISTAFSTGRTRRSLGSPIFCLESTRHRSATARRGRAVNLYLAAVNLYLELGSVKQAPLSSGLLSVGHNAEVHEMGC